MIFDSTKRFLLHVKYNTLFLLIFIFSIIVPSIIISTNLVTSSADEFHFNVISAISKEVKNFNLRNNNSITIETPSK